MIKDSPKYKAIMAARHLRKEQTYTEKLLWKYLDNRGMCGFKFRRQHPFYGFVLDFYCPEKQLGIEVDGSVHNNLAEYDSQRQNIIEYHGIKILRFNNEDISTRIKYVLKSIKDVLIPSPQRGEGCRGEV